jgi:predicted flap endonuclease-1-like 5' DNA nuclease
MAKLSNIVGIGPEYEEKLAAMGIRTTDDLLRMCATPQDRKQVAEKTGISGKLLMQWLNHADLFRIDGIGPRFANLLELAGVDTVPELAQRNPASLYKKLMETNQSGRYVKQMPTQRMVKNWVEQAKNLPRAIQY